MNDYPSRVTLYEDGVYRWSYDMYMWRNRFMLKHVLKILGAMCALLYFTMTGAFGFGRLTLRTAALFLLIPAALFLLALLIYLICALAMRGRYHLRFEMDERTVALLQSDSTKRRNRVLAAAAAAAGSASGQRSKALRVGAALGAADSVGITAFSDVTSVSLHPREDVIHLREWFAMNQIYVPAEDYAFVAAYIRDRIPGKARVRSDTR